MSTVIKFNSTWLGSGPEKPLRPNLHQKYYHPLQRFSEVPDSETMDFREYNNGHFGNPQIEII